MGKGKKTKKIDLTANSKTLNNTPPLPPPPKKILKKDNQLSMRDIARKTFELMKTKQVVKKKASLPKKQDKKMTEMEKKARLLLEKNELLIKKQRELREKEIKAKRAMSQINNEAYQWELRKEKIEKEIIGLRNEKKRLVSDIKLHGQKLVDIEDQISDNKKTIEEDKKELEKKEDEIMHAFEGIEQSNKELEKKEEEIANLVNEMEENKKILIKEEKKVVDNLKKLKLEKQKIDEGFILIGESNKRIDFMLKQMRIKVENLDKIWAMKEAALNENITSLAIAKKELLPIARELKIDINKLDKKQVKLSAEIKVMNNMKAALDSKEKELIKQMKNIEMHEASVRRREIEVSRKQAIIENVSELRENIPKLKKEHAETKKQVEKELEKLQNIIEEAAAKKGLIKNKEIELMRKEMDISRRERWIRDREYELGMEQKQVEREEVHLMAKEPKFSKTEIDFTKVMEGKDHPMHPEVRPLIRKARELVLQGDINGAIKEIQGIEAAYDNLKENDPEKRQLNYEIMELKTDIKLAEISR